MNISVSKFRRGIPSDTRFLRSGYFERFLKWITVPPDDSRFVTHYALEVVVGYPKRSFQPWRTPPTWKRSYILRISSSSFLSADAPLFDIPYLNFWDTRRRVEQTILAHPQHREEWEYLQLCTNDSDLLDPRGTKTPKPVLSDHPPLRYVDLRDLAKGVDAKMPPGILVDWVRENVPAAELMIAHPPLPRAAIRYPVKSQTESGLSS